MRDAMVVLKQWFGPLRDPPPFSSVIGLIVQPPARATVCYPSPPERVGMSRVA